MAGKPRTATGKKPATKSKGTLDNMEGKVDEKDKSRQAVKGCQQINVRHILCEKHGKKEEALEKLKAGGRFEEVAREFSEDKARSGGSLGWKKRGELDPAFETVAFELDASTTAKPNYGEVKTGFGYHIMMVEGRK